MWKHSLSAATQLQLLASHSLASHSLAMLTMLRLVPIVRSRLSTLLSWQLMEGHSGACLIPKQQVARTENSISLDLLSKKNLLLYENFTKQKMLNQYQFTELEMTCSDLGITHQL